MGQSIWVPKQVGITTGLDVPLQQLIIYLLAKIQERNLPETESLGFGSTLNGNGILFNDSF